MSTNSYYTSTAHWLKGRGGVMTAGSIAESIDPPVAFSAPPEFHGESGLWTPEHFLVAAVAGCFVATFGAMAEMSKFDFVSLEVPVEGMLAKTEAGLQFTRVTLRPVLTVAQDSDRERGIRLLEKAERGCLIARSLRGEFIMEPIVRILAPVPAV